MSEAAEHTAGHCGGEISARSLSVFDSAVEYCSWVPIDKAAFPLISGKRDHRAFPRHPSLAKEVWHVGFRYVMTL